MDTAKNFQLPYASKLAVAILSGLIIAGCAEVGGKQLSLLTSSEILDPLEVPPGMTPLPESEQFQVPDSYDAADLKPEDIPPEQFRNYATWIEFEKFKEFKRQDQGFGMDKGQYREAVARGEGRFKVAVVEGDQDTTRLRVVDSASALWKRMRLVLEDMGVVVFDADEDELAFVVGNIEIKKLPTITQRMGFKEYRGRIDLLHLVTVSTTETEVVAKTEFNLEVNTEASKEFMTRLRFFLLTSYQQDEGGTVQVRAPRGKRLARDENGNQTIVLTEDFNSAWSRVGRTLEASGVSIDDLNRSQGLYFVSFTSLEKKKKKKFRLAFWRKAEKEVSLKQFRVLVTGLGGETRIAVEGAGDDVSDEKSAAQLLAIIYERLTV